MEREIIERDRTDAKRERDEAVRESELLRGITQREIEGMRAQAQHELVTTRESRIKPERDTAQHEDQRRQAHLARPR